MNNVLKVNTKLALFDYLAMVRDIASEFINDEDGTYQPQIGKLNAIRLFYNNCVTKSKFDKKYGHDVIDASDMEEIVADDKFMKAYNKAIIGDGATQYDFANAYKDAIEIVNVKKTSFGSAVNIIGSMINKIFEGVSPLLTEENIEIVSQIAKDMSNGKVSAEAIVDAYADRLAKEENSNPKVVPIKKRKVIGCGSQKYE